MTDLYGGFVMPEGGGNPFPEPGSTVAGTVLAVVPYTDREYPDRGTYPAITLQQADGSQFELRCAPVVLRRLVLEQQPQIGDHIAATFTHLDGRAKVFTLTVTPGAGAPAAQPAVAAQPAAAPVAAAPAAPVAAPAAAPAPAAVPVV